VPTALGATSATQLDGANICTNTGTTTELNITDYFRFNAPTFNTNYPPYNIVKTGDYTYDIELALAGFGKKDIDVQYHDGTVTVKSIAETKEEGEKEGVLHRGISKRQFTKSFSIADDVEVKGAELKDGLLRISLERIIPEAKKARSIEVK